MQSVLKDVPAKLGELTNRVADIPNKTDDLYFDFSTNDPNPAGGHFNFNYGTVPGQYVIPQAFGRRVISTSAQIISSMDQVHLGLNVVKAVIDSEKRDHVTLLVSPSTRDFHAFGVHAHVSYLE